MRLERFRVKTPVTGAMLARCLLSFCGLLLSVSRPGEAFNLDVENPAVYTGPNGSYFGYSVDFYLADSASIGQSDCHSIDFDTEGDRTALLNDTEHQIDFKSHQWFGATVRSHGDTILACAPLYSWRTEKITPVLTPQEPATSQSVTRWDRVISAAKEDIIKAYYPGYFMQSVEGQKQTRQVMSEHDDSYQGYSIAVGEFSGDQVSILNGTDLKTIMNFTGEQEMGRVYVYLQRDPLQRDAQQLELLLPHLTGSQVMGRFGSTIAPLGDLNQDGFNDVAISCPFGGEDQQGLVYIFNGFSEGLKEKPSQVISGQWAAGSVPASFGFSLRGNKDLDMNGYPDLIVGAFGVNKAVLYRSRPIVNTSASLTVSPTMINPEEKNCIVTSGNSSVPVSCVNLSFCISAEGKHLPDVLDFQVEVQLDSNKHKQKGAVRRALFLDSQQPSLQRSVRVRHGERVCNHTKIYLRDEKDFRDKLSSIYVALNFSLDPKAAADSHGLRPILNYQTTNVIEQKAQILLDCGEDNICSLTQLTCSYETENQTRYLSCDLGNPMKSGTSLWAGLRFTVPRLKDTHKTVQFELQIRSKNENNSHSEVVPYKLEVEVQADVILQGVSRPDKVFFPPVNWKLTKNYEVEQDVGPPVEHIFELVNNGPSRISHTLLELRCPIRIQGQTLLYPLSFSTEGPINCTADRNMNHQRLKRTSTEPPILALKAPEHHVERRDCWALQCTVGILEKGTTAILKVRSRVWAETFTERAYKHYVLECLAQYSVEKMPYAIAPKHAPSGHKKPDIENSVPLWIIILAILAGLLLLALLIYVLYKFGFFKRSLPYGTAMEKAQLKPQAASEA
ncbi:hypothetical protein F7725_001312 [Dissostichus mawsoni]|uniref:Integrin alpha-2 domain-containing protein n=1 Tax=Dissostichus mawsoni TaxID=36200 RepID=A0A7J5ZK31_DISMA|nr:hypothetical protein F7725_001312 [Dissostichus mawsoni]